MELAPEMRIVRLVRMGKHSVDHGGTDGRRYEAAAQDGRLPFAAL